MFSYVAQDLPANSGNTKGKVIAVMFRIGNYAVKNKFTKILFVPYLIFYRLFVEWFLGIELPYGVTAGKGLQVFHGQATVVNKNVVFGTNCILRQCTTIGNSTAGGGCPVIGNNVEIGSNVCIIGDITIGDNVIIGAGTIVVKSIPSNSVVVGNPAKIIKRLEQAPIE